MSDQENIDPGDENLIDDDTEKRDPDKDGIILRRQAGIGSSVEWEHFAYPLPEFPDLSDLDAPEA